MWVKEEEGIRFDGTKREFNAWVKEWYKTVPKCSKFRCCHELMSCGIAVACGDCSRYETMLKGAGRICNEVSCIDCLSREQCKNAK